MTRRFFSLSILLASLVLSAAAQPLTIDRIKSSNQYYFGDAVAELEQEATDHALKNLVQSIAVNISSQMTRVVTEKNGSVQDTYENVVNSYSNATLRDVKYIKQPGNGGIQVFVEYRTLIGLEDISNHVFSGGLRYEF